MPTQSSVPSQNHRSKEARAARAAKRAASVLDSVTTPDPRLVALDHFYQRAREEQRSAALMHAEAAAAWVMMNRPEVGLGIAPQIHLIAKPDTGSLAEFEDYGRAGNAVKLCDEAFGELWWCDPEGRQTQVHECLLYATKASNHAAGLAVLLRFQAP